MQGQLLVRALLPRWFAILVTRMIRRLATILSLLVVIVPSGCGTGSTTQGTLYQVNVSRELEVYEPKNLEAVHAAALKAVEEMGYSIDTKALDAMNGMIEGRTALGKPVRIKSFKQGEEITRVTVYAGGDEHAARQLLDKMEAALD